VLQAIVSNNANSTEPATAYAYQWWLCTANGTLQLRNSSNTDWIAFANATTGQPFLTAASNSTAGVVQFADVGNSTDYTKPHSAGGFFDTPRVFSSYSTRAGSSGNGTQAITGCPFAPKYVEITAIDTNSDGISAGKAWPGGQNTFYGYETGTTSGKWSFSSGTAILVQSNNSPPGGYLQANVTLTGDGMNLAWVIQSGDWSARTITFMYTFWR